MYIYYIQDLGEHQPTLLNGGIIQEDTNKHRTHSRHTGRLRVALRASTVCLVAGIYPTSLYCILGFLSLVMALRVYIVLVCDVPDRRSWLAYKLAAIHCVLLGKLDEPPHHARRPTIALLCGYILSPRGSTTFR